MSTQPVTGATRPVAGETRITDAQAHNLSARSHPIRGRVLGLGTYNASDMRAVCARQCHNRKYVTITHNIDRERQKVHFAKIRPLSLQPIVCHAWLGTQINHSVVVRGGLALRGIHDIPLSATDHSAPVHTVMKYHSLKHRSRVFPVLGKVFQHSYSSLEIFMVLRSGVFIARLLGPFVRFVCRKIIQCFLEKSRVTYIKRLLSLPRASLDERRWP